jgi:ABC-type multidrug transport system fused ATPase/permease subunit
MKNSLRSKNFRLLFEIIGSKLRKTLFLVFVGIIILSTLDFLVLSLIYQFVNSLLNSTDNIDANRSLWKILQSLNPSLILPAIALIIGLKSSLQYCLQVKINYIFAKRESYISSTIFKATLREKTEARKNRESVESLFLIDGYLGRIFGQVRSFPLFLSEIASTLVLLVGLVYLSPRTSTILISIVLFSTVIIFKVYSQKQKAMSLSLITFDRNVSTIKIESQKLATELILGNRVDQTCEQLEINQLNSKSIMGRIALYGMIPKYFLEITLFISLAIIYFLNHSGAFLSTLAILSAAAFRVVPMIGSIVSNFINMKSGLVTLDRLSEIVSTLDDLDLDIEGSGKAKPPKIPFFGDLILENVTFQYGSSRQPLFENLNLCVKGSTTTLLTGSSGIGKTTFLHLILGLLEPTRGKVLISDGSAKEIMNESISGISFLQQGVSLLSGTVAENIAGSTLVGFSEERIKESIIASGLEPTVTNLINGFNTHVGEDANHFSAGERQRLGLARALYVNPGLLILDEPTSNLDAETEAGIWRTLAALKGKMTIIIVSHRGVPEDVYDQVLHFTKKEHLTVVSQ